MRTPTVIITGLMLIGIITLAARNPYQSATEIVAPQTQVGPALAQAPAAAPAQVTGPHRRGGSPADATPAAAPGWDIPDPDTLPDDIYGRTVRRGRDLITRTSSLIGPDAVDPAMRHAGNGLDCQSCHIQAGTQQFGIPLAGIWGVFPQYIGRENQVRTLEERVNGCMERSMNGRALPVDGPEMKAILTYVRHISAPQRVGQSLVGRGTPVLPLLDRAADPVRGQAIYTESCAACHGAHGLGQRLDAAEATETGRRYRFPPVWGPDSYNDGAGMARVITAARFVHGNMPLGTTFEAPAIPPADSFDVMAFINSQPRPHRVGLDADFPDRSNKPVDAAYPPYVGPFTPDQHRFGPWQPIQEWLRTNPAAARAVP